MTIRVTTSHGSVQPRQRASLGLRFASNSPAQATQVALMPDDPGFSRLTDPLSKALRVLFTPLPKPRRFYGLRQFIDPLLAPARYQQKKAELQVAHREQVTAQNKEAVKGADALAKLWPSLTPRTQVAIQYYMARFTSAYGDLRERFLPLQPIVPSVQRYFDGLRKAELYHTIFVRSPKLSNNELTDAVREFYTIWQRTQKGAAQYAMVQSYRHNVYGVKRHIFDEDDPYFPAEVIYHHKPRADEKSQRLKAVFEQVAPELAQYPPRTPD